MTRHNLGFLSNVFGFGCLCFAGIVFESGATEPTPIILMFLTGFVAAGFHDEYRKEGGL